MRRALNYVLVAAIAFLVGLAPMWLKARQAAADAARAETGWQRSRIQNLIGSAAINARHGDYVPARQSAGEFFAALASELQKPGASAFDESAKSNLRPLLEQRDTLIGLLSRSDPAAAERLSVVYFQYVSAMK